MKHFRKLILFFLVISLIIAFAIPTAINATDQTNPLLKDAQIYAEHHGITVTEAIRRFELQNLAGELDNELSNKEPETFAGLWIEHKPAFRIVVRFTCNGEETAKLYLNKDLYNITEIRSAEYSLVALQSFQNQILSDFRRTGIPVDTGINIYENRVKVNVAEDNRAKLNNALNNGGLKLPNIVDVNVVPELAKPAADIYGGLSLSLSTTGFSVKTIAGIKGVTAAGHADDIQSYGGYSLPFVEEKLYGYYDIQWHTAPNFTVTNKIKDGSSTTRNITGTVSRSSQSIGGYVAKYGKTTGYTAGYIIDKSVTLSFIPSCQPTFIHVDDTAGYSPLAGGGDSGGPWFLLNDAYGTTCAVSGGDAYYMAVNYITGIDVSVMTSP